MASPTNFLVWNPAKLNQQSDGEYLVESQRTDGAVSGIYPSNVANKMFYQCTTMVAAIAQMMVNKGYEMQDAVLADLITSLSKIVTENSDKLIPVGTKMWFYQNVAPVGWTVDAAVSDCVIAVRGGSAAYNVFFAGSKAGTWVQPRHNHETQEHILTAAQCAIRSHSHLAPTTNGVEDYSYRYELSSSLGLKANGYDYGYAAAPTQATEQTYADVGHDHGTTSLNGTNPSWRPAAAVGIVCTKN